VDEEHRYIHSLQAPSKVSSPLRSVKVVTRAIKLKWNSRRAFLQPLVTHTTSGWPGGATCGLEVVAKRGRGETGTGAAAATRSAGRDQAFARPVSSRCHRTR